MVVQLFPDGCFQELQTVFVLASQEVEPFLALAVLLRETNPLPVLPPPPPLPVSLPPCMATTPFCTVPSCCVETGLWVLGTRGTLHLDSSFSLI